MPQLDDEFLETEATNLKIARKLLNIVVICFLMVLGCSMIIGALRLRHEVYMVLNAAGMLAFVVLAPIGLVYSIRSFVKKESGKNKKWFTLFGFIVFNLLVALLIGFIAYDILTKL